MTKRNENIVRRYERSDKYELYQCYGSISSAKLKAWEYCKELCYKKSGTGLKVISYNGFQFTAGFKYEEDGKLYLMYISKEMDLPILIEEVV